jgi:hypothetical protein
VQRFFNAPKYLKNHFEVAVDVESKASLPVLSFHADGILSMLYRSPQIDQQALLFIAELYPAALKERLQVVMPKIYVERDQRAKTRFATVMYQRQETRNRLLPMQRLGRINYQHAVDGSSLSSAAIRGGIARGSPILARDDGTTDRVFRMVEERHEQVRARADRKVGRHAPRSSRAVSIIDAVPSLHACGRRGMGRR